MSLSALVGGCVLARKQKPESALTAYAEALAEGDAQRAYALLTPQDRAALTEPEFGRTLRDSAREARELGDQLKRAPRPRVYAVAVLEDGTEVRLERGERGFHIADPLTRFYGQSSPRATLLSFIRAVERARWDVVLRVMPNAERKGLDAKRLGEQFAARREELTRMVALLSASRAAPIEIVGDRATMPYAESYTARFLREDGVWKLEDPE